MGKVKCVNGVWFGKWFEGDKWLELDRHGVNGIVLLYNSGALGDNYDNIREMVTDKVLAERAIYRLENGRDCGHFYVRGVVYDMIKGYYGSTEKEQRKNVGGLFDVAKALIDGGSKGLKKYSKFEKINRT